MKRIVFGAILLALSIGLLSARPARAGYIDPNVGGVLFQVLVAAFAVLSGLILLFSRHIRAAFARTKRFLRSLFKKQQEGQAPREQAQ
jgi:hypothetical protein